MMLSRDLQPPYDIFQICSKLKRTEIEACPFRTKGLRGMATIASNPSDVNCIIVNSNLTFVEQNFHGFHELIHIVTCPKYSGQTFSCFDTVKPHQDPYIEWVANEGAAELLVSYRTLLPMIKNEHHNMIHNLGTYEFCEKYADLFNVSPAVLQNRIESLKYEIVQYLNGTAIENIQILSKNAQQNKGIYIKSLVELENERLSNWISDFKIHISTEQK